jgi:dextranase
MGELGLRDLKCAYLVSDDVVVTDLPAGTVRALVRTAFGDVMEGSKKNGSFVWAGLPTGTHVLEIFSDEGTLLGDELFGVRRFAGEDPVMGFATSFDRDAQDSVLSWLGDLRCTVVQIYDWMDSYSSPLATTPQYEDPLGRSITTAALEELIEGIKARGTVAQAYAPVVAADEELAQAHNEWRLFRNDQNPQSLGDLLQIMDPGNAQWQKYWVQSYGHAANVLGFNGLHLDTYGYPRSGFDLQGNAVDVEAGYESFVAMVRRCRPEDLISFNQVNGVPRGFVSLETPSFRYVEVWPPNDKWRHLEGLLERSLGEYPAQGDTLSLYPPVWSGARNDALRTCVLSEAVTTMLGCNLLMWGDDDGVLSNPYYVEHEHLSEHERGEALGWHRFALRCRDLFRHGTDTSWYELSDENAAVTVSWDGVSGPEPNEASLFVRVRRTDRSVVIGLLDLTGSSDGSWTSGSVPGRCSSVEVSLLLSVPEAWSFECAALGVNGGRFQFVAARTTTMLEGHGVVCSVPVNGAWSVLRIMVKENL